MPDLGWDIAAAACVAVALGALVQSIAGFGLGLLSGPALAALDPQLVPAPVLLVTIVLGLLIIARDHKAVVWHEVGFVTFGRLLGAIAAATLLASINIAVFYVVFGLMVLVGVCLSAVGLRGRLNRRNLIAAGVGSGVMGTFASIGAPPILLVYQGADLVRARSTLAVMFGSGALMSVLALAAFDQVSWADLAIAGILLPPVGVGFALAPYVGKKIESRALRLFALVISTGIAVYLVLRGIWGLASI